MNQYDNQEDLQKDYDEFTKGETSPRFNQKQPVPKNKKLIVITFLLSLILAFLFGFAVSYVAKDTPKRPINPITEVDKYEPLYRFLEKNHHNEFNRGLADYLELQAIVDSLGDPYTRITPVALGFNEQEEDEDPESFIGIGIVFNYENFEMIVKEVHPDGPADKAGIMPGDVIIGIYLDGVKRLFADLKLELKDLKPLIKGNVGDVKKLVVRLNEDVLKEFSITIDIVKTPTITFKTLNAKTGYLKIHQFGASKEDESGITGTAGLFLDALQTLELGPLKEADATLIIDLRNNPGGYLNTLDIIVRNLLVKSKYEAWGVISTKTGDKSRFYGQLEQKKPYDIKILVNEMSASASEVMAAAMHYAGGYDLVGSETYGKNVFQTTTSEFSLKYGILLTYTVGHWYFVKDNKLSVLDKVSNPLEITIPYPANGYQKMTPKRFVREVKLDEVSSELIFAQEYLNYVYDNTLRVDGYLDNQTKTLLAQFQTELGLSVTGTYNLETSRALYQAYRKGLFDLSKDELVTSLL